MATVLISTSEHWNTGDSLIKIGALKIFEAVYGGGHRYFLFNRNPDVNNKPNLIGNYLTIDEIRNMSINLLLIAGSPDWYAESYKDLFPIIKEKDIPILALGIGSPFLDIKLSPLERELYERDNTMIVARDYNVQKHLPKAVVLPCPALFCADEIHTKKNKQDTGYIVQCSITANQTSEIDFSEKRTDENVLTIYKDEARFFTNSKYSFDVHQLLNNISEYKRVNSTRLHGAIGALSCGTQACIITGKGNERIIEAQKPFGDMLPIVFDKSALNTTNCPIKDDIIEFKEKIWKRYMELEWMKL